ncbi:MAG: hypothetical protein ACRCXB_06745 [Aeromonadaceae bacterium]
MTENTYHPGWLLSTWNSLVVSGVMVENGELVHFCFGDIDWSTDGICNDGIMVWLPSDNSHQQSMVINSSMKLTIVKDEASPLQSLAIAALSLNKERTEDISNE